MTQYVHALKEIAPNEEITISCKSPSLFPSQSALNTHTTDTDSESQWAERQHAIHISWGFACGCSICRQPADHIDLSDKRLQIIKSLKDKLNDWTEPQPERPKMAELLIDLYEQERLFVPMATGYEAAAYAYSVIGDEYRTMMYAGKAVDALTIMYGAEHELTLDMEIMMRDPKLHRTWLFSVNKTNETADKNEELTEAAEAE